jgi:hypothetical protein
MSSTADRVKTSTTPYLDRLKPLPPRNPGFSEFKSWQIVLFLLGLILKVFRVFYGLSVLIILVHEVGHVLGGLLVGDKFDWIRIGPLKIQRAGKFRWTWNWGTVFTGSTRTLPVSRTGLRWKLLISTLAGPAANLASAWLIFLTVPQNDSMTAAIGKLFVAGSVVVAFVNLIPVQRRGTMNDGMRAWVLLFRKHHRERLISLVGFVADAKQGVVKESQQGRSLERLSTLGDASADDVFANYAAYTTQKDLEAAAQYLESCLAKCSAADPEFREELIVEAAKHQILRRSRPDLAREWLTLDKSGKPRLNRYFAEALILLEEKRLEEAIAKVEEALVFIEKTPEGALRERQAQTFEKWRTELQAQLGTRSPERPSED